MSKLSELKRDLRSYNYFSLKKMSDCIISKSDQFDPFLSSQKCKIGGRKLGLLYVKFAAISELMGG